MKEISLPRTRQWELSGRPKRLLLAVLAVITVCSLPAVAAKRSPAMLHTQMLKTIAATRGGHTAMQRTESASRLERLTRGIDPNSVDDATMNDMIRLLDPPEESVRLWIAAALGNLGARARVAAPKLIEIIPNDCPLAGLSSSGAIRLALKRMGVPAPPPARC